MTPTARTLQRLRRLGYVADVVERRLPRCHITRDFLGIIDVLAVKPGEPVLGVQCTSSSNAAARLAKALAVPALRTFLTAGCAFEVWGWSMRGPRGGRKLWDVARRPVALADLPPSPAAETTP
jgi:hypothetical protein